jgi:hypothetical protein
MRKEPASASRDVSVERSSRFRPAVDPRSRSRVTNGKALHVAPPGDNKWSRRFRDLFAEICGDLGGSDHLSEAQKQLARRAATISLECEKLELQAVSGETIDLDTFGQLTDRLGRVFGRLGLKRVAHDVTPTLAEYLAEQYPADGPPEVSDASEGEADERAGGGETRAGESPGVTAEPSP